MIVYYQILFWDYFGRNIHKGLNFLASLYPMKYLNPFLLKETLLDIAILLISIFFIEIGYLCWWNFCFLISVSPTSIFFFSFLYTLSKICIFLKFIIFHFFSYISGSDLESSEKLLTLQEMRLFYLMLKKLLFFF